MAMSTLKQQFLELSEPDADGVYRNGSAKRMARTNLAMRELEALWNEAVHSVPFQIPDSGIGLAAVGSLARGQIGPASDLDLVLITADHVALSTTQLNEFANKLWYPIWDSGLDLDHSVRTLSRCESVTDHDLPAAMGWLNVNPIAGDRHLIETTATAILERWRKAARKRLPELLESANVRNERFDRMSYVNQPDIKESRGGLRDTVLLSALAASWLADRPHGRYDDAVERLLDVRDAIHLITRKDADRLLTQYQAEVAAMLGLTDPTLPEGEREAKSIDDLQTLLASLSRTIAFALDSTASRAQRTLVHDKPRFSFFQILSPRAGGKREAPKFEMLAPGVAKHEQEIVLAPQADPLADPALPLRVAAAAGREGLPINTSTLVNLKRAPIHDKAWSDEMRRLFVELLASGERLPQVWEELDFVGIPGRLMPEWDAIRNRPSVSAAHRYTIDRHMLAVTAQLGRERPVNGGAFDDVHYTALLLAGILHDIGKRPGVADHAAEGARHAAVIVRRMGFDDQMVDWVRLLVREHLTLSDFASSRNPNDPEVGAELASLVDGDPQLLDMLFALTKADMSSLGATAGETISNTVGWSKWRARLVTQMAALARASM